MVRRGSSLIALAFVALTSSAQAEPADAQRKAAAQALFDEARQLTAAEKFAEACPKFAESLRLDPQNGTKFYLADCLEHTGKLASAWTYYVEVTDAARAAGQVDRERFARERAEAVKPRLSRLTIAVPSRAAGLSIARDGIEVGEAQWGTAIPVDPGEHVVAASAPGKQRWEKRVAVEGEGTTVTVEVPALAAEPVKVTQNLRALEPPSAPPRAQRISGIVVGAAGVVGLGIGAAFGAIAMGKQSESNDGHCDAQGYCDDAGLALRHDAIGAATVSTVGFVAGAALVAGGAVLYFTAPKAAPVPQIAVGPGSVTVTARW